MATGPSRRRFLKTVMAGTGAALLVPARRAFPAVAGKTKITFAWPFATGVEGYEALAKEFAERSKSIEVEVQIVPQAQVIPKFTAAFSGGAAADCMGMSDSWLSQFAAPGWLEDLGPYLSASGLDKDLLPASMAIARQFKNTAYYAGFHVEGWTVYYNKQLFQDAGIKAPAETVEEFQQHAVKLTDASKNRFGYYALGGSGWTTQNWSTWMFNFGGLGANRTVYDAAGKCILNGPKHVEGLQRWIDLYAKDKVSPAASATAGFQDMTNAFNAGQVGMMMGWGGLITSLPRGIGMGKFGVAKPPAGPAGRFFYYAGNGYCINKASKNKEAAWEWIRFLLSPEINQAWNKDYGVIPSNIKAWGAEWLKDERYKAPLEILQATEQLVHHPRYLPDYATFQWQIAPPSIQKAMLGQQTAQQHADTIAAYLTNSLAKTMRG